MSTNLITPHATLPVWPGIEAAMEDVRQHGLRTGTEKMIVLNPDGTHRYTYYGDEHQVEIKEGDNISGAMVVHDHPVPVELSIADLAFATAHQTAGIVATMPDGSWSYAHRSAIRLPTPSDELLSRIGFAVHPFFEAMMLADREYHSTTDHAKGARLGNRVIWDYLVSRGYVEDYRLNLLPQAAHIFTGLRGLNL